MMSRWRVVGPLALVAASLMTGGGAAAAQESDPAEPGSAAWREQVKERGVPAATAAAMGVEDSVPGTTTRPGAPTGGVQAAALPPGLCYGASYADTNESNDTLLDASSYALGFDCTTSDWWLNVVTFDAWAPGQIDWVDLSIDTDGNFANGCLGGDYYYAGWIEADGSAWYSASRTPNCDFATWRALNDAVGVGQPAGNQVYFVIRTTRFEATPTIRWQSTIKHVGDGVIDFMPNGFMEEGAHRSSPGNPCNGRCFHLKNSFTGGPADVFFHDGQPATQILYGDWDGDGVDSLGFRNGTSYVLKNTHASSPVYTSFSYGRADDRVLVGDWDGDGDDSLGLRRGNIYHLKDTLGGGNADRQLAYGRVDDVVLVGDWDGAAAGNGTDTLAVRRGNTYYFANSFAGGPADDVAVYGRPDDAVLVGDWDGGGADTLGIDTLAVRRGSTYFLKNSISSGNADITFSYGRADDITFTGDWDGDRNDTLGVRR